VNGGAFGKRRLLNGDLLSPVCRHHRLIDGGNGCILPIIKPAC
jgi:hypothetical protein